jgi:hypothetical protein
MAEPWKGLGVNPRNASDRSPVRLATYNSWFAVVKGEQEEGYPECMPSAYVKHTGEIPFDHAVKHLMRLRTGAHHLWIENCRWLNPCLPRYQRVCQNLCTWGSTVEDELRVLFECPTYHRIRLKYEHTLFASFEGVFQVAKSVRKPGIMSAFLNQDPKQVAAFVSKCLAYRRFEAPDLDPYVTYQGHIARDGSGRLSC